MCVLGVLTSGCEGSLVSEAPPSVDIRLMDSGPTPVGADGGMPMPDPDPDPMPDPDPDPMPDPMPDPDPDPDPDPGPDPGPEPEPEPDPTCGNPTEQEQLVYTNQARADAGLGPLRCDELMTTVARAHAQDMCDQDYFSHTALDGRSPFDRMRDAGVSYRTAGENIAWGQPTPGAVHDAWMRSDGHRRNILGSQYGRIGIGYVDCGGRPYWVQVFAD